MEKEQLEKLIYQAWHEGFFAGYIHEENPAEPKEDWQEYRARLAQELGW